MLECYTPVIPNTDDDSRSREINSYRSRTYFIHSLHNGKRLLQAARSSALRHLHVEKENNASLYYTTSDDDTLLNVTSDAPTVKPTQARHRTWFVHSVLLCFAALRRSDATTCRSEKEKNAKYARERIKVQHHK